MASLDPWIKSSPFFMTPGHFTKDQMYGLKINDYQWFFPQANGTEFNYCPSMDILQVIENILTVCFIPDKNFVNLVHAPYSFRAFTFFKTFYFVLGYSHVAQW